MSSSRILSAASLCFDPDYHKLQTLIRQYETPVLSLDSCTFVKAGNVFETVVSKDESLKQQILSFDSKYSIRISRFLVKHCTLDEVICIVVKNCWDDYSKNCLMEQACMSDRHDVFDYLVSIGIVPTELLLDISTGSVYNTLIETTPSKNILMNCCFNGDIQTAIKLIMNGTKVNSKRRDYLMSAITNNRSEMVELLVSMGTTVCEKHIIQAREYPQMLCLLNK